MLMLRSSLVLFFQGPFWTKQLIYSVHRIDEIVQENGNLHTQDPYIFIYQDSFNFQLWAIKTWPALMHPTDCSGASTHPQLNNIDFHNIISFLFHFFLLFFFFLEKLSQGIEFQWFFFSVCFWRLVNFLLETNSRNILVFASFCSS